MSDRLRSVYRRYRFYRRVRGVATILGAVGGIFICFLMYRNLASSDMPIGRSAWLALIGAFGLSVAVPWLILTPLARKPSEI